MHSDAPIDLSVYPFVSLCGKEINFIRPDDPYAAVGFSEIVMSKEEGEDEVADLLYAGRTLKQTFHPELLLASASGRLYHPLTDHRGRLKNELGLLHPHVSQHVIEIG
jgi:hypothetical protein